jgi:hypothetical protein
MNPENPNRPKVSITEHPSHVPLSKSKKLSAIVNRIAADVSPQASPAVKAELSTGLKSEFELALQHAQQLIDARINDIMHSLPQGKRNKLFSFRFGSVEAIKALELTAAFKKLDLNAQHINLRVLKSVNYHGDTV